jgi:DNA-directed RNA polymerase subunit M/transcription elongation factor TFIIS
MRVEPTDGRCRECNGLLDVTDADEDSLTVTCRTCGEEYALEPDGLNDGGMIYHPRVLADKLMQGGGYDA